MQTSRPRNRTFRHGLHLKARRIWWPRLRRRTLFLAGGIAVGILAVAMAKLADLAQAVFRSIEGHGAFLPLLVTPAGFAVSLWLTRRYFDGAQGSGIPQVIAARHLRSVEARGRLV